MDTQNSMFDTLDLDEIRKLIGEDAPEAPEQAAPKAPAPERGTVRPAAEAAEKPAGAPADSAAAEKPAAAPARQAEPERPAEAPERESAPAREEPAEQEQAPEAPAVRRRAPAGRRTAQGGVRRDVEKALEQHREDAAEEKAPRGYDAFTMLHDLVIILATLTLVFVFFFRLVGVDGESMIPTFYNQDYLILESNFLYKNVERGDIIVLKVDAQELENRPIVKRVIATEGQTVDIDFETGEVTVDGKILIEPYIYEPTYESYAEFSKGLDYPVTVPKGHIFVMGDDRNHSADSRYSPIGCVSTDSVLGKVLFLVFPGRETDVYGNVTGKRDFGRIGVVS